MNRNKQSRKIIIDSALGSSRNIGKVIMEHDFLIIGNGINRGIELEADVIIKGVVGKDYKNLERNKLELKMVDENTIKMIMDRILNILPILV